MALVTNQQLQDAAADCQSLSNFVNGAPGTITTRLGRLVKTLSELQQEAQNAQAGPFAFASMSVPSTANFSALNIFQHKNVSSATNGGSITVTLTNGFGFTPVKIFGWAGWRAGTDQGFRPAILYPCGPTQIQISPLLADYVTVASLGPGMSGQFVEFFIVGYI